MAASVEGLMQQGAGQGRPHDPFVLASSATGVVGCIERYKGDVDRIFGRSGLAPEMAGSPTLQLSLVSFCRLFEQCSRQTHNDNFGLWFGHAFNPRDFGMLGYATVSAPTLGSALATLAELHPLHQQSTSMRLTEGEDGLARFEYRIESPGIIERRQDAEMSIGMFCNVARDCLGAAWSPEEVHFEHPRPEGWQEHERAFGAPVYFSQPTNAFLFKPELLATPMPSRDSRLMMAMRECLIRLADRTDLRVSVVDRVRAAVRARLPDGFPSIEDVAAELRLAVGVIQRELNREGPSYRVLVETTRRELAMSYIGQRQLPFSEIAFLLGYSELSAFSRAVHRWTGHSPRELRKQLLASD